MKKKKEMMMSSVQGLYRSDIFNVKKYHVLTERPARDMRIRLPKTATATATERKRKKKRKKDVMHRSAFPFSAT